MFRRPSKFLTGRTEHGDGRHRREKTAQGSGDKSPLARTEILSDHFMTRNAPAEGP
jgi:hypothetical protein